MFGGIIEEAGRVVQVQHLGSDVGSRLVIACSLNASGAGHNETAIGDSISVDGCCLTVVMIAPARTLQGEPCTEFSFEAAPETLRRTTLGELAVGSLVNLERSLAVGARLHGHFVSGHVDAAVKLRGREVEGNSLRLSWEIPRPLRPFIAPKGSIALAGVSLTVGEVTPEAFSVYIIPHTAEVTTLGKRTVGQRANLEVDMLARYVQSIMAASGEPPDPKA